MRSQSRTGGPPNRARAAATPKRTARAMATAARNGPIDTPTRPLPMPKGTKIEVIAHFDNSTKNALNPDPTRTVTFGEQTWDEMMNGFFDIWVDSEAVARPASSQVTSQKR